MVQVDAGNTPFVTPPQGNDGGDGNYSGGRIQQVLFKVVEVVELLKVVMVQVLVVVAVVVVDAASINGTATDQTIQVAVEG